MFYLFLLDYESSDKSNYLSQTNIQLNYTGIQELPWWSWKVTDIKAETTIEVLTVLVVVCPRWDMETQVAGVEY